jgi:hypothetical protein
MEQKVKILDGVYRVRGELVNLKERVFTLLHGYREGTQGGYIVVEGASCQPRLSGIPDRQIRIRVNDDSCYQLIGETAVLEQPELSDQEIIKQTRQRFDILKEMTGAVKQGTVRAMIVSGPPGVGKSFGVEEVLTRSDLFDQMTSSKPKFEIVKGAMSAIGLYTKLYEYSDHKNVVVFDDCDSVLLDDVSLNILKAALDSSKKRTISWNTDSSVLRREGVPDRFTFNGGVIFITNINFENVKSKKLQDHLAALESRCHYIDLKMSTDREKVLRIKQIVSDGMLTHYRFSDQEQEEVVDFIMDNRSELRELSLRTVLKVADLRKSFPLRWQDMASVTVMKNR